MSLRLSYIRGAATHEYLSLKSRFCGRGRVCLFHGGRWSPGCPRAAGGRARLSAPRVLVVEVALRRTRQGLLVPRVALVHRVPKRIVRDERLFLIPIVEVRGAGQDAPVGRGAG